MLKKTRNIFTLGNSLLFTAHTTLKDECLIAILVVAFDHEMLVPYRYFAAVDVRRAGFVFDREDVFDVVPVLCVMHDRRMATYSKE